MSFLDSFNQSLQANPNAWMGLSAGLLANPRDLRRGLASGLSGFSAGLLSDQRALLAQEQAERAREAHEWRQEEIARQAALQESEAAWWDQNHPSLAGAPAAAQEAFLKNQYDTEGRPFTVVGPDGQVVTGYGDPTETATGLFSPTETKTRNTTQSDLMANQEMARNLIRIAGSYDPRDLTLQGRAEGALARGLDFIGEAGPEQKEILTRQTTFKNNVNTAFNQYRKEITGAAASVQELERLKDAMFNAMQSPTEFEAAFRNFENALNAEMQAQRDVLAIGVSLDSPEFEDLMSRRYLELRSEQQRAESQGQGQPPQSPPPGQDNEGWTTTPSGVRIRVKPQ